LRICSSRLLLCYPASNALLKPATKYKAGHPREGQTKDLLEWSLNDLFIVAKKAKWIPATLTLEKRFDHRKVKSPVPTNSITKMRNLVHPARYLKDMPGKEYTEEEMKILYASCHAVYTHVQDVLVKDVRKSHTSDNHPWQCLASGTAKTLDPQGIDLSSKISKRLSKIFSKKMGRAAASLCQIGEQNLRSSFQPQLVPSKFHSRLSNLFFCQSTDLPQTISQDFASTDLAARNPNLSRSNLSSKEREKPLA
jgi:hypothetical protein